MNEALFFLYQNTSGTESVLKMIGLILLCVLIIAASYYTTRFVGKKQMGRNEGANMTSIEVFRLSGDKYLQLVKLGSKYIVLAISKNSITTVTELSEEEIVLRKEPEGNVSFKKILSDIASKKTK